MVDQIIFLGTAGDAQALARPDNSAGGFVYITPTIHFHIDPGNGAISGAKKFGIPLRDTDVILLSGSELLLTSDVNALIEVMTLGGLDRKGVTIAPYAPLGKSDDARNIVEKEQRQHIDRMIALSEEDKVGVGDIEVIPTPNGSPTEQSLGFTLRHPNYSIGYTGVAKLTKSVASKYQSLGILVVGLPATYDPKDPEHMASLSEFVSATKPKLCILTHLSHAVIKSDPLELSRMIQRDTSIQCVCAKPGYSVDPKSFADKVKQAKLK